MTDSVQRMVTRFLTGLVFTVMSLGSQASTTVLIYGDSLSAGYGMESTESWVALLEEQLKRKYKVSVVNASVSGETTSGGKARLGNVLNQHNPDIVVLELGGNDGLRGQPLNLMTQNLQAMITDLRARGTQVVLAGMQIPPNYGPRYTREFKQVFESLAEKNTLVLIPFFLEGVGGDASLMQADGIHPNVEAQPIIAAHVKTFLEPLLDKAATH